MNNDQVDTIISKIAGIHPFNFKGNEYILISSTTTYDKAIKKVGKITFNSLIQKTTLASTDSRDWVNIQAKTTKNLQIIDIFITVGTKYTVDAKEGYLIINSIEKENKKRKLQPISTQLQVVNNNYFNFRNHSIPFICICISNYLYGVIKHQKERDNSRRNNAKRSKKNTFKANGENYNVEIYNNVDNPQHTISQENVEKIIEHGKKLNLPLNQPPLIMTQLLKETEFLNLIDPNIVNSKKLQEIMLDAIKITCDGEQAVIPSPENKMID